MPDECRLHLAGAFLFECILIKSKELDAGRWKGIPPGGNCRLDQVVVADAARGNAAIIGVDLWCPKGIGAMICRGLDLLRPTDISVRRQLRLAR